MTKVKSSEKTWYGGDDTMTAAENGGGDGERTCGGGNLRTLELFPVRGSWVKGEEESDNGNNGWGN